MLWELHGFENTVIRLQIALQIQISSSLICRKVTEVCKKGFLWAKGGKAREGLYEGESYKQALYYI